MNPPFASDPIFIGGDHRSGTTLLAMILDSHPDLVVGPELDFLEPENLGPYVLHCCDLLLAGDPRACRRGVEAEPELQLGVQFAKHCHRFGIEFATLAERVERAMAATASDLVSFEDRCRLIEELGELRRRLSRRRRWGIKIQRKIADWPRFLAVWPRAALVHIVRDGRDVACSQLFGGREILYTGIEEAAAGWAGVLEATRRGVAEGRIYELRYEDLVAEPAAALRPLLRFLGVAWNDRLLRHERHDHDLFDNPYEHPSFESVRRPIGTAAVGRYRRELSAEQIAAFEAIAGRRLRELGYPTGEG